MFDCLITFLKSPRWKTPVVSFIEEHCLIFDNEEENKLEYTTIHKVGFICYWRICSNSRSLLTSSCASSSPKWALTETRFTAHVKSRTTTRPTEESSSKFYRLTTSFRSSEWWSRRTFSFVRLHWARLIRQRARPKPRVRLSNQSMMIWNWHWRCHSAKKNKGQRRHRMRKKWSGLQSRQAWPLWKIHRPNRSSSSSNWKFQPGRVNWKSKSGNSKQRLKPSRIRCAKKTKSWRNANEN